MLTQPMAEPEERTIWVQEAEPEEREALMLPPALQAEVEAEAEMEFPRPLEPEELVGLEPNGMQLMALVVVRAEMGRLQLALMVDYMVEEVLAHGLRRLDLESAHKE